MNHELKFDLVALVTKRMSGEICHEQQHLRPSLEMYFIRSVLVNSHQDARVLFQNDRR